MGLGMFIIHLKKTTALAKSCAWYGDRPVKIK